MILPIVSADDEKLGSGLVEGTGLGFSLAAQQWQKQGSMSGRETDSTAAIGDSTGTASGTECLLCHQARGWSTTCDVKRGPAATGKFSMGVITCQDQKVDRIA